MEPVTARASGTPPTPLRTLVVTGANEAFAGMLRGLVDSLHQWQPRPFTALACLDVGLAPPTRDWIARHADHVVEPEWDLVVHKSLRVAQPHLRAMTARPFLRRYFPGYDLYLWIDADAWVQERSAIDAYFDGASNGSVAVAPHDHPAYRHSSAATTWRFDRRRSCFGKAATVLPLATYWNSGVFALAEDAPHWDTWAHYFALALAATGGKQCCDQTALNRAVQVERPPVAALSAHYNWLTHLALPAFDAARGRYCDPLEPQTAVGILHLSAHTKNLRLPLRGDDRRRTLDLHYPPELMDAVGAAGNEDGRVIEQISAMTALCDNA